MRELFKTMLSNDSGISSARFINILGFFTATALIAYDTYIRSNLDNMNFTAYLAYCAGGFAVSKGLDYLQTRGKNDTVQS